MTTPNDIPDILAGTAGTEQAAYENDPNAVAAALSQDPNLLNEILQPGFVEVVNELAGDAAPTLGTTETVSQAFEGANNESLSDAFNNLQAPSEAGASIGAATQSAESPTDLIHDQLEAIQSELAGLSAQSEPAPGAEIGAVQEPPTFELGPMEPGAIESAQPPTFETPTFETAQIEPAMSMEPDISSTGNEPY